MDRARGHQTCPPRDLDDNKASAQVLPKKSSTLGVSVSPCNFLVSGYVCTCPRCIACKEVETQEWLKQASQENISELPKTVGLANPSKWRQLRKAIEDSGNANMSIDEILDQLHKDRGEDDAA